MSISAVDDRLIAEALLMQISMPPNLAAHSRAAATTAASSRTSSTSGSARPPAASTSRAALWTVPASFGCGSAVLAAMAILAPSAAARSAIARPIPRLAPVMNSVLPARLTRRSVARRSLRRRRGGPELDVITLRVRDEEGATLALRAVARGRSLRSDAARGKPGDQPRLLERRQGEAEVIDVAPRPLRVGAAERAVEGHQIDEAAPRSQLCEAELRLLPL